MSVRQLTPPPYLPAFTHRPGTMIHLAGTSHVIQVFPTALRLFAYRPFELELVKELAFPELGPFSGWTAFVDSMRQYVQVEGSAGQGFVRYRICVSVDGVMLKPASCDLRVIVNGIENTIAKGDTFPLVEAPCSLPQFPSPRLLLGCNKASNWDRISDAPTMDEVLPLWYQLSPQASEESLESSTTLFGAIVEAFKKKETSTILSTFATYFRAGMAGYFVPKRTDNLFLGYGIPLLPDEMSLQDVHTGICTMVRSLFLREEGNIIEILPCLPKELVSGRLLHETLHSGHQIDIEWRKGRVRRVHLYAQHDGMVTVKADAVTATLRRLRSADRKTVFRLGEEIEVQEGKHYLLDNFTT